MFPSRLVTASAVLLALLSGCQSANVLSNEELDSSVATMTRSDVTRSSDEDDGVARAINLSQGYRTALRTAILENQGFQASVSRYRGAEASIRSAQSATRPQLTADATVGAARDGEDASTSTGAMANVALSQLIFDGGRTRANIARTTAEAYAARANIAVSANDVGQRAAQAWIDLWQANTHNALLQDRINEVSPLIERIERLITNGIVDRAALAAAQRQFLDLKLEEERLQADLRDARERFHRYYGERPRSVPAPQRLFTDAELARMSSSWPDAPALIVAAAELIAAERAVEAAEGELRPTVNLRVGASSPTSGSLRRPDANVGLVLQHTFGDGGRRAAEIDRLTEQLQAGRATFEDTKDQTRVDVETALSRHRTLSNTISVLDAQIRELNTERETLRSQIASGQANMRQLVESEVLYYRALARRIDTRGELTSLEIRLASLTGELTSRLSINLNDL